MLMLALGCSTDTVINLFILPARIIIIVIIVVKSLFCAPFLGLFNHFRHNIEQPHRVAVELGCGNLVAFSFGVTLLPLAAARVWIGCAARYHIERFEVLAKRIQERNRHGVLAQRKKKSLKPGNGQPFQSAVSSVAALL